jgi:hypothetical protein
MAERLPNVVNILKFRPRALHEDETTNLDSTGHKDREGFVVVEIMPGKRCATCASGWRSRRRRGCFLPQQT